MDAGAGSGVMDEAGSMGIPRVARQKARGGDQGPRQSEAAPLQSKTGSGGDLLNTILKPKITIFA